MSDLDAELPAVLSPKMLPFFSEVLDFRSALDSETDRGCALMAASYLDDQLKRLLTAFFVDDPKSVQALFEGTGALSSFSSRIEAVYALGLVPRAARRDLDLIRKIRNDFGHTAQPLSFDDGRIASRCAEFHHSTSSAHSSHRSKFTNVVMAVCAIVHVAIVRTSHRPVPDDKVIDEAFRQDAAEMGKFLEQFASAHTEANKEMGTKDTT